MANAQIIRVQKRTLHRVLAGATLASAFAAQNAVAQTTLEQVADDSWRFVVGGGVFSRPKYPGSGSSRILPLPLVGANYGRYFIGGTPGAGVPFGVGVNFIQTDNWRVGVAVGGELEKPRKASDAPILNGWGDIPATALGSVFATYTRDWVTVSGAVTSDIGGKHEGTRIALDLLAKYSPIDRLTLSAGPGVTWADSKYSQTFFGIDAAQSVIAGVPQYTAGSGINTVRFSVGAEYNFTPQWSLGARVTAARLRGDAANSPITEDKSQNVYGVFASYRF
jgi:outer membrane protein